VGREGAKGNQASSSAHGNIRTRIFRGDPIIAHEKATPETAPPHVAPASDPPARPARITGGHYGRLAPPVPFDGFSRRQATPFAGKRFKRGSAARRFQ